MKKLILLFSLLFSLIMSAQQPEISPYFPENPIRAHYQTQFTYYDLNFVNMRVQDYLDRNMRMSLVDTKFNINDNEKGTVDFTYIESLIINSNRKPHKIIFSYTVEPIGNLLVIKKCKITGASNKIEAFFIGFWKTDL